MRTIKTIAIEVCDVCKHNEIADYNDWCVVCEKQLCEDCQSDEYNTDDGAMCKDCEKKGFSFKMDANGEYECEVLLNDKKYKGETYW